MRLRQLCFVAETLGPAVDDLCAVLGIEVCFRDTGVGQWGLENAVFAIGGGNFLEVVAPTQDGTAAGRYLARRHGDGGYMVILQCPDAVAERERITAQGVRAAWTTDRPHYRATHFHPSDVGGVLLSVDSVEAGADYSEPMCSWEPAGPDWPAKIRDGVIRDVIGAELQSGDPAVMAELWSRLLDKPALPDGTGAYSLALDNAGLRFVAAEDGRGPGLGAITVEAADPDHVFAEAERRGLPRDGDTVTVCGVRIRL